jgi:hypothetical protein
MEEIHTLTSEYKRSYLSKISVSRDMFLKKVIVLKLNVSGGSTWVIIAMSVKRPFQLKSFSIR